MEIIRNTFNDEDKVTLALLLEEGRAKLSDLRFHLILTQQQVLDALNKLRNNGTVMFEESTRYYILV